MKISEKGAVSIYGMGRFPVTLYKEQWLKLLDMSAEIRAFYRCERSAIEDEGLNGPSIRRRRCCHSRKLPPTITYVGSIEPFRDETKIYVESLRRANVPVEFEVFDGAFHGFDVMVPDAPISKRANQFLMENFQKFVQRYFP